MPDNLDLYTRRKRLRLRQIDVARSLGLARAADVSEFETEDKPFPRGVTREDYEALLDSLERERVAS